MSESNRLCVEGNYLSIREVFFTFHRVLCHFAWMILKDKNDAEDVVQEVFIKLSNKNLAFPNDISFRAYLYVMTKNACVDYLRIRTRRSDIMDDAQKSALLQNDIPLDDSDYASLVFKEECFRMIETGIHSLSPQSRKIMELHIDGVGNQQIAEILGISINTVKTLKARSIKMLKKNYGKSFFLLLSFFSCFLLQR